VSIVLAALAVFVLLPGCSKKKPATGYETGQAGVGEGSLGGSSLDRFRHGTLGAGEEGPLRDVRFDYDSFELGNDARDTLRGNADWLRENTGSKIEIEGHCDDRGTVEYNLALGAKRAKSIRDYLASLGVPSDRLTTISYGEELPLCHEETESCWAQNRRGHFVVLNQ
jgi:peptidoglycan-associated lipoprotein